jgi:hypothetical protein
VLPWSVGRLWVQCVCASEDASCKSCTLHGMLVKKHADLKLLLHLCFSVELQQRQS